MLASEEQKKLIEAYGKRWVQLASDPRKLGDLENVLDLIEDYLHLCRCLKIPIEPQIASLKQGWIELIGPTSADQFELTIRRLAELRDKYRDE
jgi:hypothetical protein